MMCYTYNTACLEPKFHAHWKLVDDSHPRFNLWRAVFNEIDDSYCETFPKNVDPNFIKEVSKWDNNARKDYIVKEVEKGKAIYEIADEIGLASVYVETLYRRARFEERNRQNENKTKKNA